MITKQVVEQCDHLIDLHGGDTDESLRPYSYWTRTGNEQQDRVSREMVLAFGLDHIIISTDRPKDPQASRYLENTATTRGKPSITVEAGHAGTVETDDVNALVNGCLSVMRYLKMTPGSPSVVERPVWIEKVVTLPSEQTGIFYPRSARNLRRARNEGRLCHRLPGQDYLRGAAPGAGSRLIHLRRAVYDERREHREHRRGRAAKGEQVTMSNDIQMKTLSRRAMLLKTAGGLGAASLVALSDSSHGRPLWQDSSGARLKGRLKQSACRWCYRDIPLENLAKAAAEIGLKGIDLLNDPNDWPVVKKYGLIPTMTSGAGNSRRHAIAKTFTISSKKNSRRTSLARSCKRRPERDHLLRQSQGLADCEG